MRCPFCGEDRDKVVDSRDARGGEAVRRRRECLACGRRYTTYEKVEDLPAMVVKKDGRREPFDRRKLLSGLVRACEKRPVAPRRLEKIADEIEALVGETSDREMPTSAIGELVMDRLREIDKVAYVRFASVYRQFEDVAEFFDELRSLMGSAAARKQEGR